MGGVLTGGGELDALIRFRPRPRPRSRPGLSALAASEEQHFGPTRTRRGRGRSHRKIKGSRGEAQFASSIRTLPPSRPEMAKEWFAGLLGHSVRLGSDEFVSLGDGEGPVVARERSSCPEGGSWRSCLGRCRLTDWHERETMSTIDTTPTTPTTPSTHTTPTTWLPHPQCDWHTVPYTPPKSPPQVSETRGVGQHVFDRPAQERFHVLAVGPWSHNQRHHASRRKFCLATPRLSPPRENRNTAAVAAGREPSVASPAVIATRAMAAPGGCEVRCLGGRGEAVAQKRNEVEMGPGSVSARQSINLHAGSRLRQT